MIEIQQVKNAKQRRRFIGLPWQLYKDIPCWVPPLRTAVRDVLDVEKNPFFRHAKLLPLLALVEGQVVGRAAGIIDADHNRFHQEKTAFFGFFEARDRQDICNGLLDCVSQWAKGRGMNCLRGPMNPSTNHECGLLVDGFDKAPRIMMTYNPPYYMKLLNGYGLVKAKDLTAWDADSADLSTKRLIKVAERQKKRSKILVREVDMNEFEREMNTVLDIYNNAWSRNWGFVPLDELEFKHLANEMKPILDPHLCLIVEVNGIAAAFGLAVPNINQVLQKIPSGRLLPFGALKLLWYLYGPGRRSTITESRIITLGVKKDYRTLGLSALLYAEYVKRSPERGMPVAEASWILEDNRDMIKTLETANAKLTRRYRIYEKRI